MRTKNPKSEGEGYFLYIDVQALDNSTQHITAPKRLPNPDAPSRARVEVKGGDILFSLVRPYLKNIARVPEELDGQVASTAFCAVRPADGVSGSYLFRFLIQDSFIDALPTYGNSPPAARDDEFYDMTVPVPPADEQRRIVQTIEEQLSRLDVGVAGLQRARAKLKRYRTAVLKAAVEGRLTKSWREENPDAKPALDLLKRILKERRERWEKEQLAAYERSGKKPPKGWRSKYKEPAGPNENDLSQLPEGWCWSTVGQLADVGTGATPLRGRADYYENGTVPWVTSGALNDLSITDANEYITDKALAETNVKIFPSGTLLVAMYGEGKTRGKVAELGIDAATNQACAALVFGPASEVCRPYVKQFMLDRYLEIRRLSAGGVQPNLNLTLVRSTLVALPPLEEQWQIVTEIERRLSVLQEVEMQVTFNLKRAARLRQAVLKRAFEGKLLPQDPSDEPAFALLEKIEQERAIRKEKSKGKGPSRKAAAERDAELLQGSPACRSVGSVNDQPELF